MKVKKQKIFMKMNKDISESCVLIIKSLKKKKKISKMEKLKKKKKKYNMIS